jgi:hypothetical protein
MNRNIQKEALRQVHGQIPPKAWRPDSITGITESAQDKRVDGRTKELDVAKCIANSTYTSKKVSTSEAIEVSLCQAMATQGDKTIIQSVNASVPATNDISLPRRTH